MTDREPVNIMGVIAFPEPDKSKRRIRFIDAEYNTLFNIPDGASIVMTRMDGSSVIRSCTYIDDYHTLIGSEVYHICEFAEVAQRAGTVYEPLDPTQQPADAGCYEIYQIDNVAKVDYAFMRYERAKGKLRAAHYRKALLCGCCGFSGGAELFEGTAKTERTGRSTVVEKQYVQPHGE